MTWQECNQHQTQVTQYPNCNKQARMQVRPETWQGMQCSCWSLAAGSKKGGRIGSQDLSVVRGCARKVVESERRKALQGAQHTCLLGTGAAEHSWCSTCGVFCSSSRMLLAEAQAQQGLPQARPRALTDRRGCSEAWRCALCANCWAASSKACLRV